jgi:hypothetical protein
MAFTITWPARRDSRDARPFDPTWLAAGASMIILAAAASFRVPEESLALLSMLLILLVSFSDFRTGFLTFVALYPFMPDTWGLDIAEWMPFLTARRLCCIVLTVMFLMHVKDALDTPRVRRVAWMFTVLVALQMLAGVVSNDPLSAIKQIFGDVVEFYVPLLAAAHLFRTKSQIRTLLVVTLISLVVVSVLALYEHAVGYDFFDSFRAVRDEVNFHLYEQFQTTRGFGDEVMRRSRVAFQHSIILGLHLMCVVLTTLYLLRRSRGLQRFFLLGAMPLFCMALLFTYSRGPLLGLICGLIWLGLIGRGTRPLLLVILVCGVGAYIVMPSASRGVLVDTIVTSTDITDPITNGGGTVRARLDLIREGLEYSKSSLLFGHGPGEVRQTKVKTGTGATVDFALLDNLCLAMLLRYGVFVLIWAIYLLGYLICVFTWAAKRIPDRDAALLSAVASAMCMGNYVALMTMSAYFPLFWILLGVTLRTVELHLPEARRGKPARRSGEREENRTMERRIERPRGEERVPVGATGMLVPATRRRVLSNPGNLRFARPALTVLALIAAAPAPAAPSFYGTTGLFSTPTADATPRGAWAIGSNYVGRDYRPGASSISKGTVANFFTLTMIHNLELTIVLTNYEGKLGTRTLSHGLTPDFNVGGLTLDRTASMQWLALPQRGERPSLAFGMRDFLGRSVKHLHAQYGVVSLNRGRLTLSTGWGTQALSGPFGGVQYALTPQVYAIAEGLNNQKNGGLRLIPLKDLQLDMALMGFHQLGGGLSYRRRF